ncbi:MAG: hypothetical protein ABI679_16625 [Gemmatimonadota bacterium]
MQYHSLAFGTILLIAACGAPGTPIPVKGDAQSLEGRWTGEYSSDESGRTGSIVFNLDAGADTAQGDVLMVPAGPGPNLVSPSLPREVMPQPEPLRIQLVRVFGLQVAGQLAAYKDPDCACQVRTMFNGRLSGNTLEGVYHTYHPDGRAVSGKWKVTRKPQASE